MIYWLFATCFGFLTVLGLSLLLRRMPFGFRLLGAYFLGDGYALFTTYLIYSGLMAENPQFFKTGSPMMYLYGPFFYFFIVTVFNPRYRFRVFDLVHLLPFVLHTLELWPFWILSSAEKAVLFREFISVGPIYANWGILTFREHAILKSALIIGYSIAGFVKMCPAIGTPRKLLNNWKDQMLLTFLVLYLFVRVGIFGMICFSYLLFWLLPYYFIYFGDIAFFIDMFLCAFFLLLYPGFISDDVLAREIAAYTSPGSLAEKVKSQETPKKVKTSSSFEEEIYKVLEAHYSAQELSVPMLATLMNMSERQLFRKAKESTGKSPAEFLLYFRLEKAREAIRSNPKKTIGQIITESGFNNRSYFSKRFLEYYGVSPRDLRKSISIDRPEINPD